MPRGIPLKEYQKGQIMAFKNQGKGIREISRILKICPSSISAFLKNPHLHGVKRKTGRPKKLSVKDQRRLFRELKKRGATIPKVRRQLELNKVTRQTIFNYVKESKQFRLRKRKHHPKWTKNHIAARLAWAKKYMSWTTEWYSIIFSDEKKFNLDGPDGFQHYWHHLKNEEETYSTRQQGGGGVMVWLAVGFGGRTSLIFLKGKQNHTEYIEQLKSHLLPYGPQLGGENWTFQQDGATIHTAKAVKKWFKDNNINVLDWPSKSPDMNIVENVWASLTKKVYEGGRQFETVHELQETLELEWEKFCQVEIQNLYNSMPKRIFELIKSKGDKTSY